MDQLDQIAEKYEIERDVVARHVEMAKRSMAPRTASFAVSEGGLEQTVRVTREGVGPLDTASGEFHHFGFTVNDNWSKYSVLVHAPLEGDFFPSFDLTRPLPLRIDSGCETGQLFGDRTCDCREQLHKALAEIAAYGQGLVINIPRQDGRGMGLPFKLATLYLQTELGVNTVESGALIEPDASRDVRSYSGAMAILQFFRVPLETTLLLYTNNPKKTPIFAENGYEHVEMTECVIPPTEFTRRHLAAKQTELGHRGLIDEESGGDA